MDNENKDELNLENVNFENKENFEDLEIIPDEINIDNLDENEEDTSIVSNELLNNSEEYTLGLDRNQIEEFYDYLAGKAPRPVFAEKFFADGESRIRESSQLTTMMSLSFVPKLLAMQQSLINSLSRPESLKYLSSDEKIEYLQTLTNMSSKFSDTAMKYTQLSRDLTQVPLIYRQLLDQLLMIEGEKLPRLKAIPKLVDLDEDIWNRIIEIANIKD